MAMNGNEGGSAYPPNPDVKSGSCLIAGFQPLTVFCPSYWNAYKAESGATFSIDMVRLKLSFINGKGEWLSTHAHFGFVPLKDGKLSWKGFFPDKTALGAMQDRFHGRVGALYGLSRGEKRLEGQPARRHKSVAEYKAESRRVQAELDEKAELLESARAELASTRAQLAECRSQVEGFAARFERIKAELAQIAECLSVRGFLGSFKAKLAEFAENPICKAALAAGRDFMTARDGRRAEKVLVNGAREKVEEMDKLSREMDEWSLSDEVGDMRGARRELSHGSARGLGGGAR